MSPTSSHASVIKTKKASTLGRQRGAERLDPNLFAYGPRRILLFPLIHDCSQSLAMSRTASPWDVGVHAAFEIQEKLRKQLSIRDGFVLREIRWIDDADGEAMLGLN